MSFDFSDLPTHYRPENSRMYAEATGDYVRAVVRGWVDRRSAAIKSAMDFAVKHGASGALDPAPINDPEPPRFFSFTAKPIGKEWSVSRPRARDRAFTAQASTKTPEGRALAAEIAALAHFPPRREIDEAANIITSVSYKHEAGMGSSCCGFPFGNNLAWIGDRYFVYFDNPFSTLKPILESYPGAEVRPDGVLDWRLPDGWTVCSKAEMDLVFAQAAVEAERAKSRAA